jgi:hypothetical protein
MQPLTEPICTLSQDHFQLAEGVVKLVYLLVSGTELIS